MWTRSEFFEFFQTFLFNYPVDDSLTFLRHLDDHNPAHFYRPNLYSNLSSLCFQLALRPIILNRNHFLDHLPCNLTHHRSSSDSTSPHPFHPYRPLVFHHLLACSCTTIISSRSVIFVPTSDRPNQRLTHLTISLRSAYRYSNTITNCKSTSITCYVCSEPIPILFLSCILERIPSNKSFSFV